jgi:dCTP deaminase
MLMSDTELRHAIGANELGVNPFDAKFIQPTSIDVRLGRQFRIYSNHSVGYIDPARQQDDLTQLVRVGAEGFMLHPGRFVLGATLERLRIPFDMAARLEGKSSLGRLGLLTHATAGFIDPGFDGHVTLELSNVNELPIKLHVGMKIGQICLFRLRVPVEIPYGAPGLGSRYQGQEGPTASRSWQDFPPS